VRTVDKYLAFARLEVRGRSPAYERLCDAVAADAGLIGMLETLPEPKRQPNLLFAAVRHLGGPVLDAADFLDWTRIHFTDVAGVMLERRTQTNEVGRCAPILPLLARLPQPLALIEVGASAGLCLYPDRYRYDYGDVSVGPADSPVGLECATEGPVPLPSRMPDVVWRAGLDLNPLDLRDDEHMRWLEVLIWPEQQNRLARLRAAAAIARADPPYLVRGDLTTDLPELAAQAPRDATLVVFHTSVLGYVADERDRQSFVDQVSALPGHWISNEVPGVFAFTAGFGGEAVRPVLCLDGVPMARSTPHGDWLRWFTGTGPL
jgi:hypothetical protein